MTELEIDINLKQISLTLKIKVNHLGHVTENEMSEILDLENVRIATKIESIAGIQPKISKVIKMCMTLSSKVICQGHVIVFSIFDILDLENIGIDTKINFVSCLQSEI